MNLSLRGIVSAEDLGAVGDLGAAGIPFSVDDPDSVDGIGFDWFSILILVSFGVGAEVAVILKEIL
ncbi:unnamed protein product [Periconia digitata]|uniref:Uncharacterized protein n=1 Tax=Periconia digitata TaxID=1303443 RepID=A0A9W4U4J5_9PLEO|nr:unnamed protein product [Periconia digitata]